MKKKFINEEKKESLKIILKKKPEKNQKRKESLIKIRLAGIRTRTSAIPVQRSNQLS